MAHELNRIYADRIYRTLSDSNKYAARQFWSGFVWSSILHWCVIAATLLILAPAIKDAIEYAGSVAAIQGAVNELPMVRE